MGRPGADGRLLSVIALLSCLSGCPLRGQPWPRPPSPLRALCPEASISATPWRRPARANGWCCRPSISIRNSARGFDTGANPHPRSAHARVCRPTPSTRISWRASTWAVDQALHHGLTPTSNCTILRRSCGGGGGTPKTLPGPLAPDRHALCGAPVTLFRTPQRAQQQLTPGLWNNYWPPPWTCLRESNPSAPSRRHGRMGWAGRPGRTGAARRSPSGRDLALL